MVKEIKTWKLKSSLYFISIKKETGLTYTWFGVKELLQLAWSIFLMELFREKS